MKIVYRVVLYFAVFVAAYAVGGAVLAALTNPTHMKAYIYAGALAGLAYGLIWLFMPRRK